MSVHRRNEIFIVDGIFVQFDIDPFINEPFCGIGCNILAAERILPVFIELIDIHAMI